LLDVIHYDRSPGRQDGPGLEERVKRKKALNPEPKGECGVAGTREGLRATERERARGLWIL
jgi:hypothetical protein